MANTLAKPAKLDVIGKWWVLKLEIMRQYAYAYSTILTQHKLYHIYIDGFAGAGHHILKRTNELIPGSPWNALNLKPPLRELHLIDLDKSRTAELRKLSAGLSNVKVYDGDANELLPKLFGGELWLAAAQPHIWWGVSVENRKYGLPRIEHLRSAPACVRFLSIEPLLEDLGPLNLAGFHWVIVGGESGYGARPMKRDWVISVRHQCRNQHVPFFFKQWGGLRKSQAGRKLDGRTYDEMPKSIDQAHSMDEPLFSFVADGPYGETA